MGYDRFVIAETLSQWCGWQAYQVMDQASGDLKLITEIDRIMPWGARTLSHSRETLKIPGEPLTLERVWETSDKIGVLHGNSKVRPLTAERHTLKKNPRKILQIAIGICTALNAHYEKNLGQRFSGGLTPGNIYIQEEGDAVQLVLGIHWDLQQWDHCGTEDLPFLSPEQLYGKSCGESADVYSLGCICYWLITGTLPMLPPHRNALIPKRWARRNPELTEVLQQGMNRDIRFRHPTVEALLAHLMDIQDFERAKSQRLNKLMGVKGALLGIGGISAALILKGATLFFTSSFGSSRIKLWSFCLCIAGSGMLFFTQTAWKKIHK